MEPYEKKDLTGAVGSVKSEDMMQRPSTSISQSISGRIAGVNISSNSGRPGVIKRFVSVDILLLMRLMNLCIL